MIISVKVKPEFVLADIMRWGFTEDEAELMVEPDFVFKVSTRDITDVYLDVIGGEGIGEGKILMSYQVDKVDA